MFDCKKYLQYIKNLQKQFSHISKKQFFNYTQKLAKRTSYEIRQSLFNIYNFKICVFTLWQIVLKQNELV